MELPYTSINRYRRNDLQLPQENNARRYPLVNDRKEIKLPPLIPEVESKIKACHNKYLHCLDVIRRKRIPSNLRADEWEAINSIKSKSLKIVKSDKGGDLCAIKEGDYGRLISEHIAGNPIYRRVSISKPEKLDKRINIIWDEVCQKSKIPRAIRNMYASSCSQFSSIKAVIKTHKSNNGSIAIRPIVNSVGSPGYELCRFLQQILQPIVSEKIHSSDSIIENIKSLNPDSLRCRRYPISLDVENMYHNIPRNTALSALKEKLEKTPINLSNISKIDIVRLVDICIRCNHFIHNNQVFFQISGLPMGNRLSGLLSEIVMQKLQTEIYEVMNEPPPTFRYVDDLLVLASDNQEAHRILNIFNSNPYGLKFTIELPLDNDTLPYLDFKLSININGEPSFDFYRKEVRRKNFIHANTALPQKTIHNIIKNEWQRIVNKCSSETQLQKHAMDFKGRLLKNGHQLNATRLHPKRPSHHQAPNPQEPIFYLSIPFISNEMTHNIKRSLSYLGLNIRVTHRGKHLHQIFSNRRNQETCHLNGCILTNHLCFTKGAVYMIKCTNCSQCYIGSTVRFLHTRVKEHTTQRRSAVFQHKLICNGMLDVSVLAIERNIQKLRITEALLVKEKQPTLNEKEDLFRQHIL